MITEGLAIALVTGGFAVISNLLIVRSNNDKTIYRIDQLEKKVEKHNNLVERMTAVEESEKSQWAWIDQFKDKL